MVLLPFLTVFYGGLFMTKYETLINKSNKCRDIALSYFDKGDYKLACFYHNAYYGFIEKARKCRIIDL